LRPHGAPAPGAPWGVGVVAAGFLAFSGSRAYLTCWVMMGVASRQPDTTAKPATYKAVWLAGRAAHGRLGAGHPPLPSRCTACVLAMVVLHRLRYLSDLLSCGRAISVHVSCNIATHSEKVKFVVKPETHQALPHECTLIFAMLDYLARLVHISHISDRGHTHSDGQIEACFFIKHVAPASQSFELQVAKGTQADVSTARTSSHGVPAAESRALGSELEVRHADIQKSAGTKSEVQSAADVGAPLGPVLAAGPHPAMPSELNAAANTSNRPKFAGTWERLPDRAWQSICSHFEAYSMKPVPIRRGTVFVDRGAMRLVVRVGFGQFDGRVWSVRLHEDPAVFSQGGWRIPPAHGCHINDDALPESWRHFRERIHKRRK
jgi:hypothetical protein